MASIGTIVTRVYTSRAQLPVPGATVAVTQRAGGGRHTLALRVTDENGRTAPIRVATPEPSASESPGTESPFAVCDIWVEYRAMRCFWWRMSRSFLIRKHYRSWS